jgi:hypothetical protein
MEAELLDEEALVDADPEFEFLLASADVDAGADVFADEVDRVPDKRRVA